MKRKMTLNYIQISSQQPCAYVGQVFLHTLQVGGPSSSSSSSKKGSEVATRREGKTSQKGFTATVLAVLTNW